MTSQTTNILNKREMKAFGNELMEYVARKSNGKVDECKGVHPTEKWPTYSKMEFPVSRWTLWFMMWGEKGSGKDFYLVLYEKGKYVWEIDLRRVQCDGSKYKWVLGHHRTFVEVIAKKYKKVDANKASGETRIDSGYLFCDGVSKNIVKAEFMNLLDTIINSSGSKNTYDMSSAEAIEGYARDSQILSYKRNKQLADKCKKRDGYTCRACGTKIAIGDKYIIEAHHKNPLPEGVRNTKLEDLVSLCPNCHRIAHLRKHPYSVEEIRKLRRVA